jgi:Lipocalin-like domain
MTDRAITAEDVVGTWRLISATAVDKDLRPMRMPYGPQPTGSLVLTAAGRLLAVLCDGRRELPDGGQRAFAAYSGNFHVADNRLTTRVDAASIPAMIGGDEIRRLELRDGRLVLFPPPRLSGEQRELVWERC